MYYGKVLSLFLFTFCFRNRNHTYFRVSDYSNDYEDSSTYPLQPTINTQTNFNILEAQIQEGDTLQAIALRFNCTVSLYCNHKSDLLEIKYSANQKRQ